jgi:Ca2+-binding EF-hand superfamily protein
VDYIDEVFTKKGLEKDSSISLEGVRTETKYKRSGPSKAEVDIVDGIVERFQA